MKKAKWPQLSLERKLTQDDSLHDNSPRDDVSSDVIANKACAGAIAKTTSNPLAAAMAVVRNRKAKFKNTIPEKVMDSAAKSGPVENDEENDDNLSPVGVFWDLENCGISTELARDVNRNVRGALRRYDCLRGAVKKFCAYADHKFVKSETIEELQSSGIPVKDTPHKNDREAADKALLTDMFLFAIDNPSSSIMLISGDSDFAPALRGLKQRNHSIGIAIRCASQVASDLTCPADVVWNWAKLTHGIGYGVPKTLACRRDFEALKFDMIKLLKASEIGYLLMSQIHRAYVNHFKQPLIVSHYRCNVLKMLFEQLGSDTFLFIGGGKNMSVTVNSNLGSDLLGSSSEPVKIQSNTISRPDQSGSSSEQPKKIKEILTTVTLNTKSKHDQLGSSSESIEKKTDLQDQSSKKTTAPPCVTNVLCANKEAKPLPPEGMALEFFETVFSNEKPQVNVDFFDVG